MSNKPGNNNRGGNRDGKSEWKYERRGRNSESQKNSDESYHAYVTRQTARGSLLRPRSLVTDLGLNKNLTQNETEEILEGQYQLAKSRRNHAWIKTLRWEAKSIQLYSDSWIDFHLPATTRESKPKKPTKPAREYDGSTMCRDFRLDRDPSIPVTKSDAAADVTETVIVVENAAKAPSSSVDVAEKAESLPLGKSCSTSSQPETVSVDPMDVSASDDPGPEKELRITVQLPAVEQSTSGSSKTTTRRKNRVRRAVEFEVPSSVPSKRQRLSVENPADQLTVTVLPKVGWSPCPFPGCTTRDRKIKRHVFCQHLPGIFNDSPKVDTASLNKQRLASLESLAKGILGPSGTVMQLVDTVNRSFRMPRQCQIMPEQATQMAELCQHAGWDVPTKFDLHPVSSAAALIHWRCLSILMYKLTDQQRNEFRNSGLLSSEHIVDDVVTEEMPLMDDMSVIDECGPSDESDDNASSDVNNNIPVATSTSSAPSTVTGPPVLQAMDSHFHLDRTAVMIWNSSWNKTPEDLINYIPGRFTPSLPVDVYRGVAVYSEPRNYPDNLSLGKNWTAAVGVHPKHVNELNDERFSVLQRLLDSPSVSALGEIGLDHTVPLDRWRTQEKVLVRVLSLAKVSRPIVLHLRGPPTDRYGLGVSARCMQLLQKTVSPRQFIHLHCFSGDSELVSDWLAEFPNVYFGFTYMVSNFSAAQLEGLRKVPRDRILVETDSPYFGKDDVNTPAYIGDVAKVVADRLGTPVEELLELTLRNGRELYDF